MKRNRPIVACIPAFDEERTIAKVIVRASRHVDKVVVVDDGSTDDTALIAEALGAVVIKHKRNLGYGAAIRSCFNTARDLDAEVLVTLDADGQHDPDEIPRLVDPIKKGSTDVVVGSRFLNASDSTQTPRYRKAGIKVLTRFTEATSQLEISDAQSGFRAYNRRVIESIAPTESGMGVSVEVLMKAAEHKFRIEEVPITVKYGDLRTSTHRPLYHGLDVIASILKFTSIRYPLQFYGGLSLAALTVSLVFGIWTLDLYAREGRIVTNLALISTAAGLFGTIAFFTAVILFTLISVVREKM